MAKESIPKVIKICEWCKKEFAVHRYRGKIARFCSRICLGKWRNPIIWDERKCDFCGNIFWVKPSQSNHYCSVNCYRAARSAGHFITKKICEQCEISFIPIGNRQKIRFCSSECYHKWTVGKCIPWNKGLKGIHLSCKSEFKSGEDHIFWKGDISKAPYSFHFNKEVKSYIKHLYQCKCQICDTSEDLMVHHIDYNRQNTDLNNLIPLCRTCHSKTNYNRESWIIYFKKTIIFKYDVPYPVPISLAFDPVKFYGDDRILDLCFHSKTKQP